MAQSSSSTPVAPKPALAVQAGAEDVAQQAQTTIEVDDDGGYESDAQSRTSSSLSSSVRDYVFENGRRYKVRDYLFSSRYFMRERRFMCPEFSSN